jgi:hypothetical protein
LAIEIVSPTLDRPSNQDSAGMVLLKTSQTHFQHHAFNQRMARQYQQQLL